MERRLCRAAAVHGCADLGRRDPVAVPVDPHGQPGQRHQPVLPDARLHRVAGFPVSGESHGGAELAGDGVDCGGVGFGVSAEGLSFLLIVPTLCVGMQPRTLCVHHERMLDLAAD